MQDAIRQAVKAYEADEVPVGAVIVRNDRVIARAWNQVEMLNDATAHAEMLALTAAEAAVGDWRLNDCTLYVTGRTLSNVCRCHCPLPPSPGCLWSIRSQGWRSWRGDESPPVSYAQSRHRNNLRRHGSGLPQPVAEVLPRKTQIL